MAHDLKQLSRDWFEAIWNQGDASAIERFLAPKATLNDSSHEAGPVNDSATLARQVRDLRVALPDLHIEIDDMIEEGNQVLARCTVTGTHTGPGLGMEPTGKSVSITGMALGRYEDGKVVQGWNNFDLLGLYEQLGVFKRPGT